MTNGKKKGEEVTSNYYLRRLLIKAIGNHDMIKIDVGTTPQRL